MGKQALLKRIVVNPHICFGKPCIRGHRIWVSLILDFLSDGMTIEEILQDYPQLTELDIRACIAYGAEMSREHYVDVSNDYPFNLFKFSSNHSASDLSLVRPVDDLLI